MVEQSDLHWHFSKIHTQGSVDYGFFGHQLCVWRWSLKCVCINIAYSNVYIHRDIEYYIYACAFVSPTSQQWASRGAAWRRAKLQIFANNREILGNVNCRTKTFQSMPPHTSVPIECGPGTISARANPCPLPMVLCAKHQSLAYPNNSKYMQTLHSKAAPHPDLFYHPNTLNE